MNKYKYECVYCSLVQYKSALIHTSMLALLPCLLAWMRAVVCFFASQACVGVLGIVFGGVFEVRIVFRWESCIVHTEACERYTIVLQIKCCGHRARRWRAFR